MFTFKAEKKGCKAVLSLTPVICPPISTEKPLFIPSPSLPFYCLTERPHTR